MVNLIGILCVSCTSPRFERRLVVSNGQKFRLQLLLLLLFRFALIEFVSLTALASFNVCFVFAKCRLLNLVCFDYLLGGGLSLVHDCFSGFSTFNFWS